MRRRNRPTVEQHIGRTLVELGRQQQRAGTDPANPMRLRCHRCHLAFIEMAKLINHRCAAADAAQAPPCGDNANLPAVPAEREERR